MTAIPDPAARRRILTERLSSLQREQAEALSYFTPQAGDDADRATNVEANVRLAMLESQIAAIEHDLHASGRAKTAANAGIAELGDIVTVDLGDGPEDFLLAPVEQRADDIDVITPTSPLGRALLGATAGSDIEYRATNRTVRARLLRVAA